MKDVFENCSLNSILKNISMSSFISTMKRQFKKQYSSGQVKVVSEPERIDVFLTRSCVQLTDKCPINLKGSNNLLVNIDPKHILGFD